MKKLYNVSVSFDVIVLAEDEEDVCDIVHEKKEDILEETDCELNVECYELESYPEELEDTFPYGGEGEETVGELFYKIQEMKKEEELRKKRESCMKPLFEHKERNI